MIKVVKSIVRRQATQDLYLLFGIESLGVPRWLRPKVAAAIKRDRERGIVSRYNSLKVLRGQVPWWLQALGYPRYNR